MRVNRSFLRSELLDKSASFFSVTPCTYNPKTLRTTSLQNRRRSIDKTNASYATRPSTSVSCTPAAPSHDETIGDLPSILWPDEMYAIGKLQSKQHRRQWIHPDRAACVRCSCDPAIWYLRFVRTVPDAGPGRSGPGRGPAPFAAGGCCSSMAI